MPKEFEGKVSIVTGAGRGIGRAFALALAKEGAKVVINDLGCDERGMGHSHAPADEVVEEVLQAQGIAVANYDDTSDFGGAGRIVQTALDTFGGLDILIANAGITWPGYLYEITEGAWDRIMEVHPKGTFNCIRHAAPVMKVNNGGSIITVTSGAAFRGHLRLGAYAAAKAAVYSMTLTLANELKPFNISVNSIAPGTTHTRLIERFIEELKGLGMTDEKVTAYLGDVQAPADLVPLALFLCTEEGKRVNGQCFEVLRDWLGVYAPPALSANLFAPEGTWTIAALRAILPRTD